MRPFSDKERSLVNAGYDAGPTLFSADSAASGSSTPSYSTPQPSRGAGGIRKIVKVLDDRILVFDPPETNAVASLQQRANIPVFGKKQKDIRFCFDRVFDEDCGQEEVYDGSAKELVGHVMDGFNSTVFAYGVRYLPLRLAAKLIRTPHRPPGAAKLTPSPARLPNPASSSSS